MANSLMTEQSELGGGGGRKKQCYFPLQRFTFILPPPPSFAYSVNIQMIKRQSGRGKALSRLQIVTLYI